MQNWPQFLEPYGLILVWVVLCFFPIERFLELKEPQLWEIHGKLSWTIWYSSGLRTLRKRTLVSSYWTYKFRKRIRWFCYDYCAPRILYQASSSTLMHWRLMRYSKWSCYKINLLQSSCWSQTHMGYLCIEEIHEVEESNWVGVGFK